MSFLSEVTGPVSRSYVDFLTTLKDIRALARVVQKFTRPAYDQVLEESEEEAQQLYEEREEYDDAPTDPMELALDKVERLFPSDLEWMLFHSLGEMRS